MTGKEVEQKKENNAYVPTYLPATDVIDRDVSYTLYLDMPGVDKENLSVKIEKNILEILGKTKANGFDTMKRIVTEYNLGDYYRKFVLPHEVDREKIKAELKNGVLNLTLPKQDIALTKEITIS